MNEFQEKVMEQMLARVRSAHSTGDLDKVDEEKSFIESLSLETDSQLHTRYIQTIEYINTVRGIFQLNESAPEGNQLDILYAYQKISMALQKHKESLFKINPDLNQDYQQEIAGWFKENGEQIPELLRTLSNPHYYKPDLERDILKYERTIMQLTVIDNALKGSIHNQVEFIEVIKKQLLLDQQTLQSKIQFINKKDALITKVNQETSQIDSFAQAPSNRVALDQHLARYQQYVADVTGLKERADPLHVPERAFNYLDESLQSLRSSLQTAAQRDVQAATNELTALMADPIKLTQLPDYIAKNQEVTACIARAEKWVAPEALNSDVLMLDLRALKNLQERFQTELVNRVAAETQLKQELVTQIRSNLAESAEWDPDEMAYLDTLPQYAAEIQQLEAASHELEGFTYTKQQIDQLQQTFPAIKGDLHAIEEMHEKLLTEYWENEHVTCENELFATAEYLKNNKEEFEESKQDIVAATEDVEALKRSFVPLLEGSKGDKKFDQVAQQFQRDLTPLTEQLEVVNREATLQNLKQALTQTLKLKKDLDTLHTVMKQNLPESSYQTQSEIQNLEGELDLFRQLDVNARQKLKAVDENMIKSTIRWMKGVANAYRKRRELLRAKKLSSAVTTPTAILSNTDWLSYLTDGLNPKESKVVLDEILNIVIPKGATIPNLSGIVEEELSEADQRKIYLNGLWTTFDQALNTELSKQKGKNVTQLREELELSVRSIAKSGTTIKESTERLNTARQQSRDAIVKSQNRANQLSQLTDRLNELQRTLTVYIGYKESEARELEFIKKLAEIQKHRKLGGRL